MLRNNLSSFLFLILFLWGNVFSQEEEHFILVDLLLVEIYHPQGYAVVLLSDLKLSIDGVMRTQESEIDAHLMLFDAQHLKIELTDEALEAYLFRLQKEHNLTQHDLTELFGELGYSLEEGKSLLRRNQSLDLVINLRVREQITLDKKEVLVSYQATTPPLYQLQFGTSPVDWDEPLWIAADDLAPELLFALTLPLHEIAVLERKSEQEEPVYIRLLAKKEAGIPSAEKYREIEQMLRKEKYEQALKRYKEKLRSQATFKYYHA